MELATDVMALTCICCPLGCLVEVSFDEEGCAADVSGNVCKRGADYAIAEAVRPERMVTAVLPVEGCFEPVSMKTVRAVPKDCMGAVLAAMMSLRLAAPVALGSVLLDDVCGTGVAVVATKSVP